MTMGFASVRHFPWSSSSSIGQYKSGTLCGQCIGVLKSLFCMRVMTDVCAVTSLDLVREMSLHDPMRAARCDENERSCFPCDEGHFPQCF